MTFYCGMCEARPVGACGETCKNCVEEESIKAQREQKIQRELEEARQLRADYRKTLELNQTIPLIIAQDREHLEKQYEERVKLIQQTCDEALRVMDEHYKESLKELREERDKDIQTLKSELLKLETNVSERTNNLTPTHSEARTTVNTGELQQLLEQKEAQLKMAEEDQLRKIEHEKLQSEARTLEALKKKSTTSKSSTVTKKRPSEIKVKSSRKGL